MGENGPDPSPRPRRPAGLGCRPRVAPGGRPRSLPLTSATVHARAVAGLAGPRALRWAALDLLATLALAGCEYAVATVLVVLLFVLHLVGGDRLPPWLVSRLDGVGVPAAGAALVGLALLRGALQLLSRQASHRALEAVRERLTAVEAHRILASPGARPVPASLALLRVGESYPAAGDALFHLLRAALGAAFLSVMAAGMLLVAWRETLLGLLALAAGGALAVASDRGLRAAAAEIARAREEMQHRVARACRNWLLIRALGAEAREQQALLGATRRYFRASLHGFLHRDAMAVVPQSLAMAAAGLIVIASAVAFHTPPAALVAFAYLFASLARDAVVLADHLGAIRLDWPHLEEALAVVGSLSPEDLEAATSALDRVGPGARPLPPPCAEPEAAPAPELRVEDLSFAWPGERAVLSGLSFTVPAGTAAALTGPNGSGKTTLLALVLGVLKPGSGDVKLAGVAAAEWLRWPGAVAFVGEDAYLLRGTVRENLGYGHTPPVAEEEAWRALAAVGLEARVAALPGGLDFLVEEGADGLSAGEKQALAVARALLRPPALLVLDEASAHLDIATERAVVEALRALRGRSTVLIASHRAGIVAAADQVIALGGAVTGEGR